MLESIEQQIWLWSTLQPDKIAVKSGKKSATYFQLCQRILAAADYFKNQLSQNEGNVAIVLPQVVLNLTHVSFSMSLLVSMITTAFR